MYCSDIGGVFRRSGRIRRVVEVGRTSELNGGQVRFPAKSPDSSGDGGNGVGNPAVNRRRPIDRQPMDVQGRHRAGENVHRVMGSQDQDRAHLE